MKKLNLFSLGFTYAGCFLGAGYVSGQELWQFFGAFGIKGIYGLLLTVLIQLIFGVLLIRLVHKTNIYEMDRIAVKKDIPAVRAVFFGGGYVLYVRHIHNYVCGNWSTTQQTFWIA